MNPRRWVQRRWGRGLGATLGGLLLLGLLVGSAAAEELDLGNVVVRHAPSPGSLHGYRELVFDLISRSARDHQVTLRLPATEFGYYGSIERLERTVHLPAGEEVRVRMYQPPLQLVDPWLRVAIDGRFQSGRLGLDHSHPEGWSGGGRVEPRVLLSRELFELSASTGPLDGIAQTTVDQESVDAWSPNWLAYSGWDGIILSTEEARLAPRPVAEALIAYVEAGGVLWLIGGRNPADLGPPWESALCEPGEPDDPCPRGLGVLFHSTSAQEMLWQSKPPVVGAWSHTLGFWLIAFDPNRIHNTLPVVERVGVPVRSLFLLLVGFTIVVGPVNFIVLSRRRRRTWILGTIPILSLLACIALLIGVVFGEGIVRQRRLDGFTLLDQTTQRAVSLGVAGYYSTLVPRSGLRFTSSTEVSLFRDLQNWRLLNKRPGKEVVWEPAEDGGQHFAGGWMRPRVPTYLLLRKSERRRERLDVTLDANGPTVVNGLGTGIGTLWLADTEGRVWSTQALAAGQRVTLERDNRLRAEGDAQGVRNTLYTTELGIRLGEVDSRLEELLQPGTYVARLEGSPFLEPGLDRSSAEERLWLVGRWAFPQPVSLWAPARPTTLAGGPLGPPRTTGVVGGSGCGAARSGNPPRGRVVKLEVQAVERHFGAVRAVDGLSFALESGQIFGFVGPNGAGKTTTLRMLATLDEPTAGDILLDGVSIVDHPEVARRSLGYMPDGLPTHGDVTCTEYLDVFARAYGLRGATRRRVLAELEAFTGLEPLRDRPIDKLSKGQKQRLSLARALVHDPGILLLDEPAAGLDPRARVELRELLVALAERGTAVLISSHILTELSEICHGAVILDRGRRVRSGTIDELLTSTRPHRTVRIRALGDHGELSKRLLTLPGVEDLCRVAREIEIDVSGGEEEVAQALATVVAEGFRIVEWRQVEGGLEDVFLRVTEGEEAS